MFLLTYVCFMSLSPQETVEGEETSLSGQRVKMFGDETEK